MSSLKVLVLLSSVRNPRNADRVLTAVKKVLEEEKKITVDVMDPLVEDIPLLKNPIQFYPDQSKVPPKIMKLNERVKNADAYVFITGEYNFGVPPALINMIDHIPPPSFAFKPAAVICYSAGAGGRLAVSHLEDSLISMGCLILPFSPSITQVQDAISEDGQISREHLQDNLRIVKDQLIFVGSALKDQKQKMKQPKLNHLFQ